MLGMRGKGLGVSHKRKGGMSEKNGTITVDIDPTTELPDRYLGSDEDGPQYGPMTLYDAIVETAAAKIVLRAEKDMARQVSEAVATRLEAMLDERLPAILEEALTGTLTVTDQWGGPKAQGSLRDLIVNHAKQQLVFRERGGLGRDTALTEVVRKEIDYRLSSELSEAVKEAKQQIVDRLRMKASDELAKAIAAGVRA